jgi:hypothetical protein
MESWMLQALFAVIAGATVYGAFRTRLTRVETDVTRHLEADSEYHRDLDRKLNAQFKKLDAVNDKCIILEQQAGAHLTMAAAEAKFVQINELDLHLQKLDLRVKNTNETIGRVDSKVDKMEGKLEDILSLLMKKKLK